ncbi:GTP 3',8-cyclase [Candidatus Syntrophocurvum alkaliphilum]|uniref:GTP 3',8-cyclase n=1 Tax=Candidatus Syntrophocurvum alkaliphilum TaxID=2293317 RepID=A0A6I6D827_9FIRM|nr:GTP 3',8-cyclase MoaA [Candidatus Syntrophocurvum alkaliphilum]QGT98757.1 GTP 3',8-cyclase [Candidatus Syntrophocurvum alkaliphilum]
MADTYGREINYLRISVTDRCNLRCRYCMPEEGIDLKNNNGILSFEEIYRLVKIGAELGIRKVRLTGGEPLVRKNLTKLIKDINKLPQIDDIAITTNGVLFADLAEELKHSGLNRVNFSVDTLAADKFKYITRRNAFDKVKDALKKAIELKMDPVKINTVVIKGFNDNEIKDFVTLAYEYPFHVRFIEFMPIGDLLFWQKDKMMTNNEIKDNIKQDFDIAPAKQVRGNGPAQYYDIEGGKGTIGFISPMSNHFCSLCNRLRMTAEGKLRGCLYDKRETDLKSALRTGVSDEDLKQLFLRAINLKPEKHQLNSGWGSENNRKMYQIGG